MSFKKHIIILLGKTRSLFIQICVNKNNIKKQTFLTG